jgi:Domain of unknown function (DUF4111)
VPVGGSPDPALDAYLAGVRDRLLEVLGADLVGLYLHGSAVLGGWQPEISDVDLLGVAAGALGQAAKRAIAERLTDPALRCPAAHGLEFSLITAAAARAPTRSPPFELHVAHAPGTRQQRPGFPVNVPRTKVDDGAGTPGDPDLVLYFAVCRRSGRALLGPPPREVFAEPPRSLLLEATADELRWAAGHATFAYRVLTACRVLRFLEDGALESKLAAGVWARDRVREPALVDLALAAQRAEIPMPADPDRLAAADRLLKETLGRVERITRRR